jgi:hypothetical protein
MQTEQEFVSNRDRMGRSTDEPFALIPMADALLCVDGVGVLLTSASIFVHLEKTFRAERLLHEVERRQETVFIARTWAARPSIHCRHHFASLVLARGQAVDRLRGNTVET